MSRLLVGMMGHVDHGKTALVHALTGIDTDRLPEEKKRGISIALGFAHMQLGANLHVDFIDMPGHERFVRTMISGATGIDVALLVVAANEGVKPQTIEHIEIAKLLGLRRALIVISKNDLVSPDEARYVADDVARLLRDAGLESPAPIHTSALRHEGLEKLRRALEELAAPQVHRPADGLAYLPVDRAFAIKGHGPVVTGTLRGAAIANGEVLELLPSRKRVRIRAIQTHGAHVDSGAPGQRIALNLRDIEISELKSGMALATPDSLELSEWLTIALRSVATSKPLRNGKKLCALSGTDEVDVWLRLLDRDVLSPGDHCFAQLRCATPVALPSGEYVILRLASPPLTVGGGKVLEPVTRRMKRNNPLILQRLETLAATSGSAMIESEVRHQGAAGTTLRHLSQLSALPVNRVAELLRSLPTVSARSDLIVWKPDLDIVLARIPSLLAAHATGLSQRKLSEALPGVGAAVLDEALVGLMARGVVVERNGRFRLVRAGDNRDSEHHERLELELAARIAERLRSAGLKPPNPGEVVIDARSKRAVDRLLREHVIVHGVDRDKGRELFFHREAIENARRQLEPLLDRTPGLLVTEIASALDISRKYCMPLLNHLDTIGFTRRIDGRRTRA
jgi:selenocysteine-specific elongation factor